MVKKIVFGLMALLIGLLPERLSADTPMVGAQVIIEPGQTDAEIETWFKRMNENGMKLCRIRMFEEYIHQSDSTWDFTLFDKAFKIAEKYGIKVFAGLFPASPGNSIGGFKFPLSQKHEEQIREYVFQLVSHYKNFKSLYGWVLMNEPGTGGGVPNTDYTKAKFEEWKKNQPKLDYNSKGYTLLKSFEKQKFLVDYNTWYLSWLAIEIAKYDTAHEVHVNNHQIFENIAEYDFPAWRKFLTSLGASAHPSWHFGYFNRSQYTVAMSANCNIVRSGAGDLPYLVTELQGGNNTYSGANPFCPTAEETTQWLWTSIATGAQGVIFWSLNARSIGEEAGEWALLDFQYNASDRLNAAKQVIKCINQNETLFTNVKPVNSGIYVLYNRPSFWIEKEVQYGQANNYEGREPGGVIKSALAYYEVLSEKGIVPNIGEFAEFDWTKSDYTGVSIILANTVSLPSAYWENIRGFVKKGGKLFVEGLTGYHDENMLNLFNTGFPLQDVFGGSIKEIKCIPGDFTMKVKAAMPAHLWKGYIYNTSGKILSRENDLITGTTNKFGKGEVIWIPSLLGLGGRRTGDYESLSNLLTEELQPSIPVRFEKHEKELFMQTSKGTDGLFSLVINKSKEQKTVKIKSPYKSRILFSDGKAALKVNTLTIHPEETVLIAWK